MSERVLCSQSKKDLRSAQSQYQSKQKEQSTKIVEHTKRQFLKIIEENIDGVLYSSFADAFKLECNVKPSEALFPLVLQDKKLLKSKLTYFAIQFLSEHHREYSKDRKNQHQNKLQKKVSFVSVDKIPYFIKNKPKAYQMLISYQITKQYTKQLEQVKNLIIEELKNEKDNGILKQYYYLFVQFMLVRLLKVRSESKAQKDDSQFSQNVEQDDQSFESLKQKDQNNRQYNEPLELNEQSIKEYFDKRQSQSINENSKESWVKRRFAAYMEPIPAQIKEKISLLEAKYKKKLIQIIKHYLTQGLQSIFLLACQNFQLESYGCNSARTILIFCNQPKQLTLQQYKHGPFKPYLYFVILHELAHYLLSSFDLFKVDDFDRSFDIKLKVNGLKYMQFAVRACQNIPKYFKIKKNITISLQKRLEQCQLLQKQLQKTKLLFSKFQEKMGKIGCIFSKIKFWISFFYVIIKPLLKQDLLKFELKKKKIETMLAYIKNMDEACLEFETTSIQKQYQYQCFFSLYFSVAIAQKMFDLSDNESMQKYENSRAILANYTGQKYYVGREDTIEQFIQQTLIEGTINTNSSYFKEYNDRLLIKKQYSEDMNKMVNQLIQNSSTIFQMNDTVKIQYMSWKNTIEASVFQKFDDFLFQKIKLEQQGQLFFKEYSLNSQNSLKLWQKQKINLAELFNMQLLLQILKSFYKYFELYQIVYQLPQFLLNQQPQAGTIIESLLFETHPQSIYAKDYELFKRPTRENRAKVGMQPKDPQQRFLSISLNKQNKNKFKCIKIGVCGMTRFNLPSNFLKQFSFNNRKRVIPNLQQFEGPKKRWH